MSGKVTKERPHIIDLLTLAAEQRRKLEETKIEILARPLSIWFTSEDDELGRSQPIKHLLWTWIVSYSRMCEKISSSTAMRVVRAVSWIVLLVVLINATPELGLAYDKRPSLDELDSYNVNVRNLYYVSVVVNVWLLLNSILNTSGLLIRTKVEKAFNREMSTERIILDLGIVAFTLDILCLAYGITQVGMWFQVSRLVLLTQYVLDLFPTIGILMSGIGNGFKSVMYTILLLFLLSCSYAVIGFNLYRVNDPFHFGNFALSCLTFFQLTTFESWGEIFNLNSRGCDSYPSSYSGNWVLGSSPVTILTDFGIFYAPVCYKPQGSPVASAFIFCSYTVLAGYVIVNMCLAAVAIGINERLEELRSLELFGGEEEEEPSTYHSSKSGKLSASDNVKDSKENKLKERRKRQQMYDGKAAKMLGGNVAGRKFKENLSKIWDLMRKGSKHKFFSDGGKSVSTRRKAFSIRDFTLLELGAEARLMTKNFTYQMCFSAAILAAAILQFYDNTVANDNVKTTETNAAHLFFQILFVADSAMHLMGHYPRFDEYFTSDLWNVFDLTITIVLFIPTCLPENSSVQFLEFLRVFRMARILQIASTFAMDLNVILAAIYHSSICLLYVLFIMFLFFSYFGLFGVLLFKRANPFFFGSYGSALQTLLQSMTLDNWSELMRYGMLGCNAYPYPSEIASYCNNVSGQGVGWLAAAFFVTFIIVASYVLSSLLVGVIITSMELLREGMKDELEVWEKVRKVQRRYKVEQNAIDLLLDLFVTADDKREGIVTYEHVETMMGTMGIAEDDLFAYYVQVDQDKNGQLDFSEFSEFILLIGPMYNERKDEEDRIKREEKKIKDDEKKRKAEEDRLKKEAEKVSRESKKKEELLKAKIQTTEAVGASTFQNLLSMGTSIRSASIKSISKNSVSVEKFPSASGKVQSVTTTATASTTASIVAASTSTSNFTTSDTNAAILVLEDVLDDSSHSPQTSMTNSSLNAMQDLVIESKESKEDTIIRSEPQASVKPPSSSSMFLSRIARIYASSFENDEHEDYFHHGL